jgi:hypothetical protein
MASAIAFFATGAGAPMTAPAIFATAASTAATAAGASTTALGVGAEKILFAITFATSAGAATATMGKEKSAASAARTTLHVGWGVAHIVQYLPPLLDEAHAPHTQLEAEEEETMMGWLSMLVVRVWLWGSGCESCVGWLFVLQAPTIPCVLYAQVHQNIGKPRRIGLPESSQ